MPLERPTYCGVVFAITLAIVGSVVCPPIAAAQSTRKTLPVPPAPLAAGGLPADFWAQHFERPEGGDLALANLKGRPILLNFWATWCPPCVKEMPELDRFHREFGGKGWQVIGLAIDGPTPVRDFLGKVRVGFPVGLAGFGGTELAQALGNDAGGLPFSVLISPDGRVAQRKMGATTFEELAGWARAITP